MINSDNISISVGVISYNHSAYIRQALDSVLMQKLNCKYEIVIGDDCSTDNTQEIIQEYKKKYPDIIKVINRKTNVGPTKNFYDVLSNCRGKYFILLEGDDYYTDPLKLQKQYDFLESNNEIRACAHRLEIVDKYGNHIINTLSDLELNSVMDESFFIRYNTDMLHINTIMFENFFLNNIKYYDILYKSNKWSCHSMLLLLILNRTNIFVFSDCMTVWRCVKEKDAANYTSQAKYKILEMHDEKLKLYKYEKDYFCNKNLHVNFNKMLMICYWDGVKKYFAQRMPKKVRG